MAAANAECIYASAVRARLGAGSRLARLLASVHPELWIFAAAIFLFNLHLVPGFSRCSLEPQVFLPDRVRAGEWWRLLAHPFVHVTWYHLLLDAGAFFLLYAGLEEKGALKRMLLVAFCGAGSLVATVLTTLEVSTLGLCGLSGVAHGLMVASALELTDCCRRPCERMQGAVCLALVVAKSIMEVLTGKCFLELLDFGLLGSPIPACHVGGALGGIVFCCLTASSRTTSAPTAPIRGSSSCPTGRS